MAEVVFCIGAGLFSITACIFVVIAVVWLIHDMRGK